jgi:pyruvate,water dikinase
VLVAAKRLDAVEHVFDLTLAELDRALADTSLDLRALAKENRVFIDRLAKVPQLPVVIDSRGRIVRPAPSKAGKGETIGLPVSSGVARGRVKVLHTPDEKPFLKGEILVARATDPGWTPLFVNAAAVVLEVGGLLQHGALVAREYGLPCVTGIIGATALWEDGTRIEVDGSTGVIRTLELSSVQGL